jgi:asparagine synthase (glutamine-hydrolysing)
MCGICGFTHLQSAPTPGRIQALVGSLKHRGPDQQGVFESNAVSLGAARLKIIDLQAGDQPIVSEDGDSVIAFNGEIYNFAELRSELQRKGHRFRTHTDTEIVLEAFREWDVACFSKLRGMFAVALWTESNRRLVLARDRMGIKPLYTAFQNGDLYFGSELKTIFGHPEIERRLSADALDCYLALNYVPAPWTMVDGIQKLKPGHWLEWRQGRVRSECYWKLPYLQATKRTLDSACEELDSLIQQSVGEHLVSDVPLGVWLSGGVDSSTILHYAAHASGRRLKTFSISFLGRSFDETTYIREAAEQYGTDHEEYDVSPESDLAGAIEQIPNYFDEPCADGGALPAWFLSALTRKSATVALSGEGADEVFGGYLTYRADQIAGRLRVLPDAFLKLAVAAAEQWPVSDDKISGEYMLKRFLKGCRMSPERAHVYWTGTFSDSEKRDLVNEDLPQTLDSILAELREKGDRLPAYLWFDQKVFLPDDILTKVDRVSMAHSVEVRPPFLDHRIVEFAAGLPDHLKVRGSRQKVVLKELMKRKLPASILKRKKMGFDFPAHDWLRGPLRPLLLDVVDWGRTNHPDLFRTGAIDRLVARHLDRQANVGYHLWGLMNLFLWMKRWRIQTTAECERRVSAAVTALTST